MIWVFVMGVCYGIAYCQVRRLWPLVIAHTITDIIAMCIRVG